VGAHFGFGTELKSKIAVFLALAWLAQRAVGFPVLKVSRMADALDKKYHVQWEARA
jgi:hypothetical protein